jgi:antitoxin CptB
MPTTPAASAETTAGLDPRRKRAWWRAWHRGTREMDLIMGRFADREIGTLDEAELALFEDFLERDESEVFGWVTGRTPLPDGAERELVDRLKEFRGDL